MSFRQPIFTLNSVNLVHPPSIPNSSESDSKDRVHDLAELCPILMSHQTEMERRGPHYQLFPVQRPQICHQLFIPVNRGLIQRSRQ
ncbi:hypothetical protein NPIL_703481 [Nephila pilipes]|uniref:Uncharacterized protein n=1 Tax=Nephila pilipes TaxID=299642 RepID=A0A8X6MV55_NEPPI|nr:hypothetical protein NPIL_703481 [Nephila pilipes]